MTTLHVLRSEPDGQVRDLIKVLTPGEVKQIALYDDVIDYDRLIDAIFAHDRVISWW